MARNVEIKARVTAPEALERRVAELSNGPSADLIQEDTFFRGPRGRLKLRRFPDRTAELIYYERSDRRGPTISNYARCPTHEPDVLAELLDQCLGRRGTVRKCRRLYMIGQTRVHLDHVDGLGDFLELEVVLKPEQTIADGDTMARDLMKSLGVQPDELVDRAYIDLIDGAADP